MDHRTAQPDERRKVGRPSNLDTKRMPWPPEYFDIETSRTSPLSDTDNVAHIPARRPQRDFE